MDELTAGSKGDWRFTGTTEAGKCGSMGVWESGQSYLSYTSYMSDTSDGPESGLTACPEPVEGLAAGGIDLENLVLYN